MLGYNERVGADSGYYECDPEFAKTPVSHLGNIELISNWFPTLNLPTILLYAINMPPQFNSNNAFNFPLTLMNIEWIISVDIAKVYGSVFATVDCIVIP